MVKYLNPLDLKKFFDWYERYYTFNIGLAAFLFGLQLIHLYWLSAHVVGIRLLGESHLNLPQVWQTLIVLVDYTEIPALVTTSLVYINEMRKRGVNGRSLRYLFYINSQWLHIFWITDEFVLAHFSGQHAHFPNWLAWIAIFIDYLELPVILDTSRRFLARIVSR